MKYSFLYYSKKVVYLSGEPMNGNYIASYNRLWFYFTALADFIVIFYVRFDR